MDIASVILNAKLEVLSANNQAKQILTSEDGVFLRRNSLRCSQSSDQQQLEAACHELMGIPRAMSGPGTQSISIDRWVQIRNGMCIFVL